jgi:glycosyltransferase involved in cell wall biosynthesis
MQARRRVLMLVDHLNEGGGERFAAGLAVHLPRDRFEVTVCTSRHPPGPLRAEVEAAGIRHVGLDRRGRFDVARLAGLVRLLRRERFDVLHAHKFGSNLWGSLFGRACRVPVVVAQEQTWSYEGRPLRRFLDGRVIGRLAHAFVAVSSADRERMIDLESVPRAKTIVIPNAYVPRPGGGGDLRAELGLRSDVPLVGTVCIHRRQKALEVLLEAFAVVTGRLPEARLAIGGSGPETEGLERLAAQLGLGDRVRFIGRRRDVDAVLRGLDVAAMSSDFEGTPLFALECMANGVPLVATAVGGLPDVVMDGETGLLVAPRDPAALAGAIEALLRDPDRRARMGEAARARLAGFTIERAAERFAALYERLLAGGPVEEAGGLSAPRPAARTPA